MGLAPSVSITAGGRPLDSSYLASLQSVEVAVAVRKQTMLRMRFAIGQDPDGDWAEWAEQTFTPATTINIDGHAGGSTRRLVNAVLTEFKMDFKVDPCESQLEVVGSDSLENVKRETTRRSYPGQDLQTIVSTIFERQNILAPTSGVPDNGSPNPSREVLMQAQNDLDLLRRLADENGCDVYVEAVGDRDQGHFEPLDLENAATIPSPVVANQSGQTNVRNGSFYYDLTGPTAVVAQFVDEQGRSGGSEVRSDLRDHVTGRDKSLLGPPGFAHVLRLDRHGRETRAQLQQLCDATLERNSWLVIGKGELDSATYGDVLIPRRAVEVRGVSSAFSGTFLVWEVTHSFTRDRYCQRFEVRKKLGFN